MKTFIINLKREKRRYKYIKRHASSLSLDYKIIDAVDGEALTDNEIMQVCDMEKVNRSKNWLTKGAIACALSHKKAYEEFIKTNDDYALIIEDDVCLPKNINDLLNEIPNNINTEDLVLLYYASFKATEFSIVGCKKMSIGGLYYPLELNKVITSSAYIIGKDAAKKMIDTIIPVSVAADCWNYYYQKGCYNSVFVHYPPVVKTKNFKSSINYFNESGFLSKISKFIDKYRIPIVYQILYFRRKRNLNQMLNHFSLTKEESPLMHK